MRGHTWPRSLLEQASRAVGVDGVLRIDEVWTRNEQVYAFVATRRLTGSYTIVKTLFAAGIRHDLTIRSVSGRPLHCECRIVRRKPALNPWGYAEITASASCPMHSRGLR